MDVYNPILNIRWPLPGVFGISVVLALAFAVIVIYLVLYYFRIKEQKRIHNYQLFLFQVKRKGLSNFQIKILRNMSAYMKLANPKDLVARAAVFESAMADFVEYIKTQPDEMEHLKEIISDLAVILPFTSFAFPSRRASFITNVKAPFLHCEDSRADWLPFAALISIVPVPRLSSGNMSLISFISSVQASDISIPFLSADSFITSLIPLSAAGALNAHFFLRTSESLSSEGT